MSSLVALTEQTIGQLRIIAHKLDKNACSGSEGSYKDEMSKAFNTVCQTRQPMSRLSILFVKPDKPSLPKRKKRKKKTYIVNAAVE